MCAVAAKRILAVVSEFGYWGIELVAPVLRLNHAGYEVDFMTPTGKRAQALPPSYDPSYIDPPLGKSVTSPEVAKMVKQFEATKALDNPLNMSAVVPRRPYVSHS